MTEGGAYRIGQRFGDYTLESYLGSGGFKTVYRARNHGTRVSDPVVALGFPHDQEPEGVEELKKEFAVASQLVHPNILRIYGIEEQEGVSFLVMECLEGESLRRKLRKAQCFPAPEAVRYVGQVAEALAYAHSARVLHRDIKPPNIFVTSHGAVKLLDFGIARVLARTSQRASTRIGTLEYMAPEQITGAAGTNADLWALGVTLYELLTGQLPFGGEDTVAAILAGRYDPDPLIEKKIDIRLVRILRKMLRRNPEERYQDAEELARDLEIAARRVRMVTDDESRLEVLVRASYPLIYVYSVEEERVLAAARNIAGRLSEERKRARKLYVWSASRGLRDEVDQPVPGVTGEDPTSALVHVIENPEDAIYMFLDVHRHFTPVSTRLIRDAARAVRMTRKSVLLVSPFYQAPEELEKEVSLAVFQLPDREQLEPLVDRLAQECRDQGVPVEVSVDDRAALVRAASGLTLREAERSLRLGIATLGGLHAGVARVVVESKTQIIRKSGILEYYHTPESLKDVGGLDALMDWFRARAPVFAGAARYAGLQQPKGVLLVGVPGCGKSLSARALAGAWGVPLLRLDVGRVFTSLVGASEANVRQAIQVAEAVSPCILWIDEVEKGFAGARSDSGGGVGARVFGTFLNWLQEKKSPVFVVATANDISSLPVEFLRSGRFDEKFFVGLPQKTERETIFRIHLRRRKREPEKYDLGSLVASTADFSGAEIEQAVVEAMFTAFEAGRDLEQPDLDAAIRETHPLARVQRRQLEEMTGWARANTKPASYVRE